MEDFSNILWVILIVASVIGSFATKNKDRKQKKSSEAEPVSVPDGQSQNPSAHPGKSWRDVLNETLLGMEDQDYETSQPQPQAQAPQPKQMKQPQKPITAASATPHYPVLEAAAYTALQPSATENISSNAVFSDSAPATAAQTTSTDETHTVQQGDIMEGFDVRKAVLWSEILKPKFNEDSH